MLGLRENRSDIECTMALFNYLSTYKNKDHCGQWEIAPDKFPFRDSSYLHVQVAGVHISRHLWAELHGHFYT